MYAPAEDSGEIGLVEDFKPDLKNLSKLESWVHYPQVILKVGRLTHQKPEGLEPEEEEKAVKELERKDPTEPRLKPISQDKGPNAWKIGAVGVNEWRAVGKDTKPVNTGTVYLRSLTWPGWTTVHYLNRTSSLYVGYGFKAGQFYYPCEPEKIL